MALRIWSRGTPGAGATTAEFVAGMFRVLARDTSGAGAMTPALIVLWLRLIVAANSGVGGTALVGNTGATRDERRPSAGGGEGTGLKARRLATEEFECGRLTFGASTTVSLFLSARATRIVCVRW